LASPYFYSPDWLVVVQQLVQLPSSFSAELRQRSAEAKGNKRRRTEQQSKEKRRFVCHSADDEPKQATGKEHLSQPT
jgi:hypothetical protein